MARTTSKKTLRRVMHGIRVAFAYDYRKLDVTVSPDTDDLRTAPSGAVLRLWAEVAAWARGVSDANPGWTVNGEQPVPDPDRDVPEEPYDGEITCEEEGGASTG
jgi:hypothetical protein